MNSDIENIQLAEAYISGNLSDAEREKLKKKLETDPVFASDFQECLQMLSTLENSTRQKQFRSMLSEIHQEAAGEKPAVREARMIPLRTHFLRTGVIAAGIALLTSLATLSFVTHNEKKHSSQYSLLKRELETIKRSQSTIISNIYQSENKPATPANFSGTGFALTNDGYFITNYHVTEGADSVFIQNSEGDYFKAHLITFDATADVAILKADQKDFRFGKTEVPYTFANQKRSLGTRIFTLGFPQDEIVYNEGYISAQNGYLGDSLQYQLELPAKPGQSGAPVLDKSGNIVAIVTGKETESERITYAVSTKAILNLIENTPDLALKLSKTNKLSNLKREQQIEKLQEYTCSVKVYKR